MDNATKLDVINSVLTNITQTTDTSGSQGLTVTGLNVYQIFPKKIYYPLSGYTTNGGNSEYTVMGARGGRDDILDNFKIGIGSQYTRNFIVGYRTVTESVTRYIDVDYINASGNLIRQQSLSLPILDMNISANNINRLVFSNNALNGNINVNVDIATLTISGATIFYNSINSSNCGSAIITIPNDYIGVISNIGVFSATSLANIVMYVKDKNNNIKAKRYMLNTSTVVGRYNSMGSFNYPLYPGDSVFFVSIDSTVGGGDKFAHALVTLTAI